VILLFEFSIFSGQKSSGLISLSVNLSEYKEK
jgi:hypothetical protein